MIESLRNSSPEENIRRLTRISKLELDKEEVATSLERMNTPLQLDESEDGEVQFNVGAMRVKLKVGNYFSGSFNAEIGEWENVTESRVYKNIEKLVLNPGDDEINVLDFMPKGMRFMIDTNDPEQKDGVVYDDKSADGFRIFKMFDEIRTLRNFFVMLHEMGHVVDLCEQDKSGALKESSHENNNGRAEIFRRERAANAFVFKLVRTRIGDAQLIKDVRNFLLNYSLHKYAVDLSAEIAVSDD